MSHTFIRELTFQAQDLGKDTTIMLTFDANMKGLYEDFFPVVWKVSTFGETGPYSVSATYTSQLAFSKPQVNNDGNIVGAGTSVDINVSEKTSLTKTDGVFRFSTPEKGPAGVLQAVNNTGADQNFVIGFQTPGELMPQPALFFDGVGYPVFLIFLLQSAHSTNTETAVKPRHSSLRSYGSTSPRTIKRLRSYEVPSTPLRSGRRTSLGLLIPRPGTSTGTWPLDITRLPRLHEGTSVNIHFHSEVQRPDSVACLLRVPRISSG